MRPFAKVNRIACPWLIKSFVAPAAIADEFRRIARDDYDNMVEQVAVCDALQAHCRALVGTRPSSG